MGLEGGAPSFQIQDTVCNSWPILITHNYTKASTLWGTNSLLIHNSVSNDEQQRLATATISNSKRRLQQATIDQGRNYKLTPRRRTKNCQDTARTATLHSATTRQQPGGTHKYVSHYIIPPFLEFCPEISKNKHRTMKQQ